MIYFMLCAFLFQTDTTTICNSSCFMQVKEGSNLVVKEAPLHRGIGDAAYVERQPCKKIITDTVRKKSIRLDMAEGWRDKKRGRTKVEKIGQVKVTWYKYNKPEIYGILEPDNCSCKWSGTFVKDDLLIVKEIIGSLSFRAGTNHKLGAN